MLGEILNASHLSLKDLYDCSCSELDLLVNTCVQQGAVGARLTGAGWGGMVICLVEKTHTELFIQNMMHNYYMQCKQLSIEHDFSRVLFSTKPGSGAKIFC